MCYSPRVNISETLSDVRIAACGLWYSNWTQNITLSQIALLESRDSKALWPVLSAGVCNLGELSSKVNSYRFLRHKTCLVQGNDG